MLCTMERGGDLGDLSQRQIDLQSSMQGAQELPGSLESGHAGDEAWVDLLLASRSISPQLLLQHPLGRAPGVPEDGERSGLLCQAASQGRWEAEALVAALRGLAARPALPSPWYRLFRSATHPAGVACCHSRPAFRRTCTSCAVHKPQR